VVRLEGEGVFLSAVNTKIHRSFMWSLVKFFSYAEWWNRDLINFLAQCKDIFNRTRHQTVH